VDLPVQDIEADMEQQGRFQVRGYVFGLQKIVIGPGISGEEDGGEEEESEGYASHMEILLSGRGWPQWDGDATDRGC
jgi:hypothetical protein